MFQILEFQEARLATLTPRSEKHGDDDKPAVSLGLELTVANTLLDCIDPQIRQTLYKAVDGQEQLPGVEPATPVLRCNSFEHHTLPNKYEGWTLAIDDGVDDTKSMLFGGCKVDKIRIEAKQGGSVELKLRVGTSDLDADRSGFLGMHVGQPVWITLKASEKPAEAIDGTTEAFERDHPDATDLFAAGGPEDDGDGSEGGETDLSSIPQDAWPFPTNANSEAPPQSATTEVVPSASKRTARGREKTRQALAAGARS
jgi:hypothetical protein